MSYITYPIVTKYMYDDQNDAPEPGAARVGNDPTSGELDSSFGSNGEGTGNETQH